MKPSIMRVKFSFFLVLLLILGTLFFSVVESLLNAILYFIGLTLLLQYLFFNKEKDMFSPMFLFTAYFFFVYVSGLLMMEVGGRASYFITEVDYYSDVETVYTLTIFYVLCLTFLAC